MIFYPWIWLGTLPQRVFVFGINCTFDGFKNEQNTFTQQAAWYEVYFVTLAEMCRTTYTL